MLIASLLAALVSLALIYPCVRTFQAMGIMIAAVAGQCVNLLYLAAVWMRIRSSLDAAEQAPLAQERGFAVSKAE